MNRARFRHVPDTTPLTRVHGILGQRVTSFRGMLPSRDIVNEQVIVRHIFFTHSLHHWSVRLRLPPTSSQNRHAEKHHQLNPPHNVLL